MAKTYLHKVDDVGVHRALPSDGVLRHLQQLLLPLDKEASEGSPRRLEDGLALLLARVNFGLHTPCQTQRLIKPRDASWNSLAQRRSVQLIAAISAVDRGSPGSLATIPPFPLESSTKTAQERHGNEDKARRP